MVVQSIDIKNLFFFIIKKINILPKGNDDLLQ